MMETAAFSEIYVCKLNNITGSLSYIMCTYTHSHSQSIQHICYSHDMIHMCKVYVLLHTCIF